MSRRKKGKEKGELEKTAKLAELRVETQDRMIPGTELQSLSPTPHTQKQPAWHWVGILKIMHV